MPKEENDKALSRALILLAEVKQICGPTGWNPMKVGENRNTFRNATEKRIYTMIQEFFNE